MTRVATRANRTRLSKPHQHQKDHTPNFSSMLASFTLFFLSSYPSHPPLHSSWVLLGRVHCRPERRGSAGKTILDIQWRLGSASQVHMMALRSKGECCFPLVNLFSWLYTTQSCIAPRSIVLHLACDLIYLSLSLGVSVIGVPHHHSNRQLTMHLIEPSADFCSKSLLREATRSRRVDPSRITQRTPSA